MSASEVEHLGELARVDQAAWEAPELRPVFFREDDRFVLSGHCPDWCHDDHKVNGRRSSHKGGTLAVRLDQTQPFNQTDITKPYGQNQGHLEVGLTSAQREAIPLVSINLRRGDGEGGELKQFRLPALYPDEVRELVAVLQHLLKVGQES